MLVRIVSEEKTGVPVHGLSSFYVLRQFINVAACISCKVVTDEFQHLFISVAP